MLSNEDSNKSNENLHELIANLVNAIGPDKLKALASTLSTPSNNRPADPHPVKVDDVPTVKEPIYPCRATYNDNEDIVNKLRRAVDKIHSADDPKIQFLASMKHVLTNEKRKKGIDRCIQALRIASISKLMDDND